MFIDNFDNNIHRLGVIGYMFKFKYSFRYENYIITYCSHGSGIYNSSSHILSPTFQLLISIINVYLFSLPEHSSIHVIVHRSPTWSFWLISPQPQSGF